MALLQQAAANPSLDTTNPFGFITDKSAIQSALDNATNTAYDNQVKEAMQGLNRAEDKAYANTQNSIAELRKNMAGSAANGGNAGAAAATVLQAMLGLGQQNAQLVTEGLQNVQGIAGRRAEALAKNAADAITQSNAAKGQQANIATEQYNADTTRSAEAMAALGALTGTQDTNITNRAMNEATNAANINIANIGADADKYTADQNLAGTQYAADKNLIGTQYTADKNLESNKYVADRDYAGTTYTANKNLVGTKYTADRNLAGTKYAALKGQKQTITYKNK